MPTLVRLNIRHKHCGREYMPGENVNLPDEFAESLINVGKAVRCGVPEIVEAKKKARAEKAKADEKKARGKGKK
jgi:hypothetical protein